MHFNSLFATIFRNFISIFFCWEIIVCKQRLEWTTHWQCVVSFLRVYRLCTRAPSPCISLFLALSLYLSLSFPYVFSVACSLSVCAQRNENNKKKYIYLLKDDYSCHNKILTESAEATATTTFATTQQRRQQCVEAHCRARTRDDRTYSNATRYVNVSASWSAWCFVSVSMYAWLGCVYGDGL